MVELMILYTFHDLMLAVERDGPELGEHLDQLLQDLSWMHTPARRTTPSLRLSVRLQPGRPHIPHAATEVFWADGFSGLECDNDFYLTDGASLLHLQASQGQGIAYLASSFGEKPALLQRHFWAFGLLKLLRPLGFYGLHAAGLASRQGLGLLIVGGSGCGKSTLAIGLARQGWSYLSDDAVLLHPQPGEVGALACRRHWYIDAKDAPQYPDLQLGEELANLSGGRKRRVGIAAAYPEQLVSQCIPQVLLFPRIIPHRHSTLHPLDRFNALGQLLAQSGPQLFDRHTMAQQLAVLKHLVQQTASYELQAGQDVSHDSGVLAHLLAEVAGAAQWRAS